MLLLIFAVLLIAVTVLFTLAVRSADMAEVEPVSPVQHLEDRRAAIYENLRDLQFEYRVGKLSDEDYQQTKLGLQKELAGVLAEIEAVTGKAPERQAAGAGQQDELEDAAAAFQCPHCGAEFPAPMKFCGSCGKETEVAAS